MKNLVILHLESVSRQRLLAFAPAFPHTLRLMDEAVCFDNYISSATSTVMVLTYLLHANDFELDTSTQFLGAGPERNNRNLFEVLQDAGYHANLVCLNGFPARPIRLSAWTEDLPPIWETNDFPTLFERFDALTDAPPFAIYVWDLITHIEHSMALAPVSQGLTDQVRRACGVADHAIGTMRAMLERKGLLDRTAIVLYGDHGDDFWTHGYRGGMIHGTEPYAGIIAAPLAIRDASLAPAVRGGLASTIDIAPTCLSLLGIDSAASFRYSGVDLLKGTSDFAYSQNFTANQPDSAALDIARAFAITDGTYTLLASTGGLEMFAHHLDPGNHCNLLHFFALNGTGSLVPQRFRNAASHFIAAWSANLQATAHLVDSFERLRRALRARVAAKRDYIIGRGGNPAHTLDDGCFAKINPRGRETFFQSLPRVPAAKLTMPGLEFSWKLR
ncbi:MAG: sulfatase-like hydrolase/transferase [Proteobacteria bacterium]|nr:sulfatase-like hydrolase/transferase [Pseudomonadota bacterium]